MLLDAGPGNGSFPWWVFLMMPFMMLGMGIMMWFMMRMMMGMGGHGAGHGSPDPTKASCSEQATELEVDSLRRQVGELQDRLAAMEAGPAGVEGGKDSRTEREPLPPEEGEER